MTTGVVMVVVVARVAGVASVVVLSIGRTRVSTGICRLNQYSRGGKETVVVAMEA